MVIKLPILQGIKQYKCIQMYGNFEGFPLILLMEEILHHLGCMKPIVNNRKKNYYPQPSPYVLGWFPYFLTPKNGEESPLRVGKSPPRVWDG